MGLNTVTLHVGAGTFLPVKAHDLAEHKMHAEWGEATADVAAALNGARVLGPREAGGTPAVSGRIVAVGTTRCAARSAARDDGMIAPFAGETVDLHHAGLPFRAVDALMTNFHLPRSTLFMLVRRFAADVMQRAYAHAIASGYRFYSYGDACLLFPALNAAFPFASTPPTAPLAPAISPPPMARCARRPLCRSAPRAR